MRLLLTGASGFIGWNLSYAMRNDFDVIGVVHEHDLSIPDVDVLHADLTVYHELKQLFDNAKPDAVIHAASMSNPNQCEEYPGASDRINVEVPINIAGLCADLEIPCVFTSTDLVFGGENPPYTEADSVNPSNRYGEQKATAEEEMLLRYPETAVCRLSLVYGFPGPHSSNFFATMLESLDRDNHLTLFTDEVRTMVSIRAIIEGLQLAVNQVSGILHLGGNERLTRYEFGKRISKVFGYSHPKFVRCSRMDIGMPAARPEDVSLESTKAKELGFDPWPVEKELEYLYGSNSGA